MRKESLEFLERLMNTASPMGFETEGQKVWCQYVAKYADEVRTDAYGNAVAILNPAGDPKVMIDGHIDEIGLMVKYIDDDGFIYFQRIGMVDPALVRGKRVNIYTEKGIVPGVIGSPAIHLQDRDKEKKVPEMHESFVDIGAKNKKEAEKKVSVGNPIVFDEGFEILNGTVAVARAFDDRAGAWAVAETLRLAALKKKQLKCAIYATSSVHEEGGTLGGASMQTYNIKPDIAIVVDTKFAADNPAVDVKVHGEVKLGAGPTVSVGRENHPVLLERLRKVADKKKIPLQTTPFGGTNNALAIYNKQGGIPTVRVGIPSRYTHTTVEMLNLKDLQQTADWLAAFCLDLKKGERFKVEMK